MILRTADGVQVLLIADHYGNWTLPKGHLEAGETPVMAAIREIAEETGCTNTTVLAPLGRVSYPIERGGQRCEKVVYYFLVEASCATLVPQKSEITAAAWFKPSEALAANFYANNRPVLERALQLLTAEVMTERLAAYLAGLEALAAQPLDEWAGFTTPHSDAMNFGLRFQIAFSGYALAAIAARCPAWRLRCIESLGRLIERFRQPAVWAYWRSATGSDDPVAQANIQYSGHLGHLIGLFELLGGDERFDQPWQFSAAPGSPSYTHTAVVAAIHGQMARNAYHGVECEQGCTYVSCNDHALWSTLLHDRQHGTTFAAANAAWLEFLQARLMFHGPQLPGRGAVTAIYSTTLNVAAPLGLNFMDAWSLALLAPLAPALVAAQAPRLWARLRWLDRATACLPSAQLWERMEGSDTAVNTGFACLLAVELGEQRLAAALLRYAEQALQPSMDAGSLRFTSGLAPAYTTALFALAEAGGLGQVLAAGG